MVALAADKEVGSVLALGAKPVDLPHTASAVAE
jgi:hypothetical protein